MSSRENSFKMHLYNKGHSKTTKIYHSMGRKKSLLGSKLSKLFLRDREKIMGKQADFILVSRVGTFVLIQDVQIDLTTRLPGVRQLTFGDRLRKGPGKQKPGLQNLLFW